MALVPLNDMTPKIRNSRRHARLRHFSVELRRHWGAAKAPIDCPQTFSRRINSRPIGFRGGSERGFFGRSPRFTNPRPRQSILVVTVSRATSELFGWPTTAGITASTSPSGIEPLVRIVGSVRTVDHTVELQTCPLSIPSHLIFFVSGVKTNFQLAPKIPSIRAIR
jgi:hypothetical protein